MADSNFVQASFLGGEYSPYAQGRIDTPTYPTGMNVCRNSYPLEEGAWIRRSGSRRGGKTLGGAAGRLISLEFEQAAPYLMEFTNGFLRMWGVSTQTSQLTTALPMDFRLVTTNDNVQVLDVSTANPAVVQTLSAHGWSTNDQVQLLFATTVIASFTPLLRARTFKITVVDTTHFSIADAITGTAIDGSTLGWSAPTAGTVVVMRILSLATPYTGGIWSSLRRVQAEKQAVLLQTTKAPRVLNVVTDPTASAFAEFTLAQASFIDGPYLDPPTDGTTITPTIVNTSGTLPVSGAWLGLSSDGTQFVAFDNVTTTAATSPNGITWTARTLPSADGWIASAWNGAVFCVIAGFDSSLLPTTSAATSADGITWTARTLPTAALWSDIAWNGTVFCAIAGGTSAATSANGIAWTARTLPVSASWAAIAWNGTVFCAIAYNSNIAATSPDGITWTQRTLPSSSAWTDIAWNGSTFCAVSLDTDAATSPDGITWASRSLPSASGWQSIAAGGSTFCVVGSGASATSTDGATWTARPLPTGFYAQSIAWNGTVFAVVGSSSMSFASATGVFFSINLQFSSIASINRGAGFASTDVGRQIRLLSEPAIWFAATAYVIGNSVKFNGAYYISIQNGTGKQPDISPTFWSISTSTSVATWTWGTIISVSGIRTVQIALQGNNLVTTATTINTWRLGVYSDTTGYPTCGVYYQGRLWLSGAVANRVDASRPNLIFDMAPTEADGSVFDNNAISYTFNSDGVNPIFWMVGQAAGIACGTQAGEWQIVAPTAGPITPTNIHAFHDTHYGSSNIEPEATQVTISFVQKFNQCLLEFFPDALSGKYIAPNLSENAKHLTASGIEEIRFQQELLPIIWARMGDGSLAGATYERDSLFSSQPAKFVGWHRHDFGGGDIPESIAVGPSEDGTLDTLALVNNDGDFRNVDFMKTIFNVSDEIASGWFVDGGVVPSGGIISGKTLTFYGLWDLNDKTVTVTCGGVDLGEFVVTNGSTAVTIDDSPNDLFTTSYLVSISSTTAYGAMSMYIDGDAGRLVVPAVVGFTYTSQGQILRPDTSDRSRSQLGQGLALKRRLGQFGALLHKTQGISFGTDFNHLHDALFQSPGGTTDLSRLELFSGVYWQTIDDTWGFDSMLCWEISRPYPAVVVSIGGRLNMSDRG